MMSIRKFKPVGVVLCVALIINLFPGVIFAGTEKEDRILKQAPQVYTKKNMEETEILKENVQTYMKTIEPYEVTGKKNLDVPLYKQSNNYYCGPASTRMTLKYLGKDITQSALASQMGTTSADGTYVYQIVNALNNHLGGTKYKYVLNSNISFGSGLTYSIDKGRPVICHVDTIKLPIYKEDKKSTGHYVVATGYYYKAVGGTGVDTVYYNDPNNNSKYYGRKTCTWSEMRNAILENAGYYIMSI
ncbi:C39 family peptidase [Ihubacter sp. rT4E-8]|uniref:C39 family peptidase n=1 Tax=Ihubacter sp. rT4E-8 TaxID=3242369 RepID=UPI003CF67A2B